MQIAELPNRSISANPLAIIDRIIAEVELTVTQYTEAVKSYEAVAEVLQILSPDLKPSIFPQGSMRLGTTVRPQQNDRFDLDMICSLAISGKIYTPDQVFNVVWDALGKNETYRQMRKKKNRCIRLEYADSRKFYLDVTPAVPDWAQSKSLYVPDRERKVWCSSHPLGFCDDWFKIACKALPIYSIVELANARSGKILNASNAYVEPMPKYGQFEKAPLQRIVQMVKSDRDKYFQTDTTNRPSSILLTTIITQSYSSLVTQPVSDLLEFVIKVVAKMPNFIHTTGEPGSRNFCVINPVNQLENFAENWTESNYQQFLNWHKRHSTMLQNGKNAKGQGTDIMLEGLAQNFGNEAVIRAANALGADTNTLHGGGNLRVASGTFGLAGTLVPKTIFFGSEK